MRDKHPKAWQKAYVRARFVLDLEIACFKGQRTQYLIL
jgi:hypothetical protein